MLIEKAFQTSAAGTLIQIKTSISYACNFFIFNLFHPASRGAKGRRKDFSCHCLFLLAKDFSVTDCRPTDHEGQQQPPVSFNHSDLTITVISMGYGPWPYAPVGNGTLATHLVCERSNTEPQIKNIKKQKNII